MTRPLVPLLIEKLYRDENLSAQDMESAFEAIINNQSNPAQIAGLLVGLHIKGEVVEEVLGAVKSLRKHALKLELSTPPTLDTAGTGGDGAGSFNLSTAAAIIAASLGVRVAKHYNRAQSSACGSADVMEALGLPMLHSPALTKYMIETIGIGFLFAPTFHPSTKAVAMVRRELMVRTLFNILGPLTNPCAVPNHLIGVYSFDRAKLMAETLVKIGCNRALLVTAENGLDEISPEGATRVIELNQGKLSERTITPKDFGATESSLASIKGGDAKTNAAIMNEILNGEKHPARSAVSMNAAAALFVAGKAANLREGYQLAMTALDNGEAAKKLSAIQQAVIDFKP